MQGQYGSTLNTKTGWLGKVKKKVCKKYIFEFFLLLQLLDVHLPHKHLDPISPNDVTKLILLYDSLLRNIQGFLKLYYKYSSKGFNLENAIFATFFAISINIFIFKAMLFCYIFCCCYSEILIVDVNIIDFIQYTFFQFLQR